MRDENAVEPALPRAPRWLGSGYPKAVAELEATEGEGVALEAMAVLRYDAKVLAEHRADMRTFIRDLHRNPDDDPVSELRREWRLRILAGDPYWFLWAGYVFNDALLLGFREMANDAPKGPTIMKVPHPHPPNRYGRHGPVY